MLGFLLSVIARVLLWTLRIEQSGGPSPAEGPPRIYAFPHGRQFPLLRLLRPRGMVAMVSLSKDGALQATILNSMSIDVVRGSSSRNGSSALRSLVRRIKQGSDGAFAVDGPKGPENEVKSGVIFAAKWSGAMIVPVSTSARHAWVFSRAWDHYMLPIPFSKAVLLASDPIQVPPDATPENLEQTRTKLEQTLRDLTIASDLRMKRAP